MPAKFHDTVTGMFLSMPQRQAEAFQLWLMLDRLLFTATGLGIGLLLGIGVAQRWL